MGGTGHSDVPEDASVPPPHSSLGFASAAVSNTANGFALRAERVSLVQPVKSRARKRVDVIPIFLVGRSALFRAGLRHILNGTRRFQVTAECSRVQDIPPSALSKGAGVAVISIDGDAAALLRCIRDLKEQRPEYRVVMLRDRVDADQLVAAIDSGVDSYLLRDEVRPETVLKSLEMVLADGIVVPSDFAKFMSLTSRAGSTDVDVALPGIEQVFPEMRSAAERTSSVPVTSKLTEPTSSDLARLSERERLILTYLTFGASNKLIARELTVAEATVKTHIKSLLRKLRVSNRTQAAMWAISHRSSSEP